MTTIRPTSNSRDRALEVADADVPPESQADLSAAEVDAIEKGREASPPAAPRAPTCAEPLHPGVSARNVSATRAPRELLSGEVIERTEAHLRAMGCESQADALQAGARALGEERLASPTGLRVTGTLHWTNDDFGLTNFARPLGNGDHGPTQAMGGSLRFAWGDSALTLDIKHRLFTEKRDLSNAATRFPQRRQDELPVTLSYAEALELAPTLTLTLEGRAGFVLAGNLGGMQLQDGFHGLVGKGLRVGEGLATDYGDGSARGAGLVGTRVQLEARLLPWVQLYVAPDATAAVGATGASHVEVDSGVRVATNNPGGVQLFLDAGAAVGRYFVRDPLLTFPGAYDAQSVYVQPHAAAGLQLGSFGVGVQLNVNDSNSGIDTGVLFFRIGAPPNDGPGSPVR